MMKLEQCKTPPSNRGRKRKLPPKEEERLVKLARKKKGITDVALARRARGNITPRTASNILKRSEQKFVAKLTQKDKPKTFSLKHKEEGIAFLNKVKRIRWERRVYVDETWLNPTVSRKRRRVPAGETIAEPEQPNPKLIIPMAIRLSGPLAVTDFVEGKSITNDSFEKWVKKKLAPQLKEGDVVLWDQLGKYGAERSPYRLHWSPVAREYVEAQGASVLILPSFGKLLNPIELYFRDLKEKYRASVASRSTNRNGQKITARTMKLLWSKAERELQSKNMKEYFQLRANGKEFLRVCSERGLK